MFFVVIVYIDVVVSVAVVVLIIVDIHMMLRCGHQMLTRGLLEAEKCATRSSQHKSLVRFFLTNPLQ